MIKSYDLYTFAEVLIPSAAPGTFTTADAGIYLDDVPFFYSGIGAPVFYHFTNDLVPQYPGICKVLWPDLIIFISVEQIPQ
jgi:hypothetical protein